MVFDGRCCALTSAASVGTVDNSRTGAQPGLCVLLVGLPGTGKHTIGAALTRSLATTHEVRLVDNHYTANPILGLVHQDGVSPLPAGVWERVGDVRAAVLETISQLSPLDWSFVFTADVAEDDDSYAFVQRLSSMASARRTELIVIRLECDLGELRRRIVDPARRERMKSTSEHDAVERYGQGLAALEPWSPTTLDVTALRPEEAVEAVLRRLSAERPASGLSDTRRVR